MHTTDHHALAAALANHDPFTLLYDDLDPDALSVAGLLDAAVAAGRFVAHAQAFQARVFAALQRRISAKDGGSSRGCGAGRKPRATPARPNPTCPHPPPTSPHSHRHPESGIGSPSHPPVAAPLT